MSSIEPRGSGGHGAIGTATTSATAEADMAGIAAMIFRRGAWTLPVV